VGLIRWGRHSQPMRHTEALCGAKSSKDSREKRANAIKHNHARLTEIPPLEASFIDDEGFTLTPPTVVKRYAWWKVLLKAGKTRGRGQAVLYTPLRVLAPQNQRCAGVVWIQVVPECRRDTVSFSFDILLNARRGFERWGEQWIN